MEGNETLKTNRQETDSYPGSWRWLFLTLGVLAVVGGILAWFDNTTELTPSHDGTLEACFWMAGITAFALGGIAFHKSQKMTGLSRARLAVVFTLLGFLTTFWVTAHGTSIIEGWVDFPAQQTKTYRALVLISRAYQTHGKGASRHIQTTPIWSDLDITQDDYDFMLTHRRPGDASYDRDEVSSRGYFCAQVTLQQSGDALRILHAGNHKLPKDTVIICPTNSDLPVLK